MWRSRFWNRSFHKPHGYAGDFQMIEWMYDLEGDECQDPTQPGIVNCLDHLYATVDSVGGVIERRRFFSSLLAREHARLGGKIRVLDVACGGARYIRDYLRGEGDVSGVEITLVDQDPSAIAFCRTRALVPWAARVCAVCAPIKALDTAPLGRAYDVILSAGLFDYLDDPAATALLASLAGRLAPGGVLAISNFHPADRSRSTKDWVVDWRLVFRDEPGCARLFPGGFAAETSCSENRSLTYAVGREVV
jgi:SAM-dependent methyltransferase